MINIISSLAVVFTFLLVVALGFWLYNSNNKEETYSLLNHFPYEMKEKKAGKNVIFLEVALVLFTLAYAYYGIQRFFFLSPAETSYFGDYFLAGLFALTSLVIFSEFHVDLSFYRYHLIFSALLFVLTTMLYIYLGIFVFIDYRETFYPALGYISCVLGGMMLLSLILVPFKKWMYLEKEDKDGNVVYQRKRVSILPIMEWIFISLNVLLPILITIFTK